jgi:hypothetical protein
MKVPSSFSRMGAIFLPTMLVGVSASASDITRSSKGIFFIPKIMRARTQNGQCS